MEAKLGLKIRDAKPSGSGSRGHLSLSLGKGKGSSSPRGGCFKCGGAHFQGVNCARKSTRNRTAKANRAGHGMISYDKLWCLTYHNLS